MVYSVEHLGLINYTDAWDYQKKLFNNLIEKKQKGEKGENLLLLCEHPHVYTLGKNGNRKNLLISDTQLKKIGAAFYPIDRGGDITYHGPGQLVGYPVFDLDAFHLPIKDFVFNIEEMLIRTVGEYGITATRLEKATGVWIDARVPEKSRKIAAIGMRIHNKVSMHGFALNINTNLEYFNNIIACGLQDKGVTSMQKELGMPVDEKEVMEILLNKFEEVFR